MQIVYYCKNSVFEGRRIRSFKTTVKLGANFVVELTYTNDFNEATVDLVLQTPPYN